MVGGVPSPAGRVAEVDVTDGGICFADSDAFGDDGPLSFPPPPRTWPDRVPRTERRSKSFGADTLHGIS